MNSTTGATDRAVGALGNNSTDTVAIDAPPTGSDMVSTVSCTPTRRGGGLSDHLYGDLRERRHGHGDGGKLLDQHQRVAGGTGGELLAGARDIAPAAALACTVSFTPNQWQDRHSAGDDQREQRV